MISITLKDVKIELTREEAEEIISQLDEDEEEIYEECELTREEEEEIISQLDEEEDDGSPFESEDEESYGACELAIFLDDELGLDWCKELHKELTAKQS